ncbi:mechanosensitive ion channel family protein [Paracoccus liaowanqingii]|uniref:Mechanosensitive ion channel family protein n=1 Tax=Paracoccus liaowanqingii TaxID=2560053 RepID=A0A4Z1CCE6_9RHOB|nr:mechanosensitive ion channel family protein [Paracoccus liaowanqingii]TGN61579.1 mechanosensitive ion channel family protein [Paracoccus liaowanqingii]
MNFDLSPHHFDNIDLGALFSSDLIASLILVLALLITRMIANRVLRARADAQPHLQRRWFSTIRNVILFLLLLGLALIWAPQLRTFALSLTAVAVAVVVATKELILCILGSFMRASSRPFSVGDWIEVGAVRGEVIDHSIFMTRLQQFEPGSFHYAGRTVDIPNSAFFTTPIHNLTIGRDYIFHSFSVTVEPKFSLVAQSDCIDAVIDRHYGAYAAEARKINASLERRTGVDLLDPEVSIRFSTTDIGKYRVNIRLFCPTRIAERLENDITRDLMAEFHDLAERPQE